MKKILLVAFLFFFAGSSFACSFPHKPYELRKLLKEELADAGDSTVVFLGKVVEVHERLLENEEVVQEIRFEPSRWWKGEPKKVMQVSGASGTGRGTSCEGAFDFMVRAGQEWLIVGDIEDGIVKPSTIYSGRVLDGRLPGHLNLLAKDEECKVLSKSGDVRIRECSTFGTTLELLGPNEDVLSAVHDEYQPDKVQRFWSAQCKCTMVQITGKDFANHKMVSFYKLDQAEHELTLVDGSQIVVGDTPFLRREVKGQLQIEIRDSERPKGAPDRFIFNGWSFVQENVPAGRNRRKPASLPSLPW